MENDRLDGRALLAIAIAMLTWSSAYAAIAYALASFTPGEVALARVLIASVCFAVLLLFKRPSMPAWRDWPALAVLGAIGLTMYYLCLSYAETRIPSGTAAIIISLVPGATAALSALWLRERLGARKLFGLSVALAGVVLVVLTSGHGLRFEPMAALMLLCVLASAVYFVGQKPYFARSSTLGITAVTFFGGTLAALPFGAGSLFQAVMHAPLSHTLSLVYLGVAPTFIGYMAWNIALRRAPASQVSSFIYLSPPLAVLIGWLWLGEQLTWLTLAGGLLTIAGVVLINTRRRAAAVVSKAQA